MIWRKKWVHFSSVSVANLIVAPTRSKQCTSLTWDIARICLRGGGLSPHLCCHHFTKQEIWSLKFNKLDCKDMSYCHSGHVVIFFLLKQVFSPTINIRFKWNWDCKDVLDMGLSPKDQECRKTLTTILFEIE